MPPVLHRQAEARRHRRPGRALREALRPPQEGRALTDGGFADLSRVDERRQVLLEAKLRALVREHTGTDVDTARFGLGAAAVGGPAAWVLVDENPVRGLGPALAWARARRSTELNVVVDEDADGEAAGVLARRAGAFAPAPAVWLASGRSLRQADPAPVPAAPMVDPRVAGLADVLAAAGVDIVVEHGVLVGEVLGLEVARVVEGPDGPVLQFGVGRFDREATAELFEGVPDAETLAGVVETVRRHRRPGAPPHPLNRLAPERWLRAWLLARPGTVGADHLGPLPPPLPRHNLKEPSVAPAVGTDPHGGPIVAVCSTGIDLDLVPSAADARLAAGHGEGARLVLVVPQRDAHPVTRALAGMLAHPAELVAVPDDWR